MTTADLSSWHYPDCPYSFDLTVNLTHYSVYSTCYYFRITTIGILTTVMTTLPDWYDVWHWWLTDDDDYVPSCSQCCLRYLRCIYSLSVLANWWLSLYWWYSLSMILLPVTTTYLYSDDYIIHCCLTWFYGSIIITFFYSIDDDILLPDHSVFVLMIPSFNIRILILIYWLMSA